MYRFKVSKYKNAAPKLPKKELWISEIPCGQVMASYGDFVTVSAKHVAFNIDSGVGGCAGILPLMAEGRCNRKVPTIYAHSEFLTDMCFSPFHDDLLATCSHDGLIKLWDIPENVEETMDKPLLTFTPDEDQRKLDIIKFHPSADEILSCVSYDAVTVIDINVSQKKYFIENDSESPFQSCSWKLDGTLMITSCKDTNNRIIDPRNNNISLTFNGFTGNRDSRLLWMGNSDYIFGTGFDKQRNRKIGIWDVRNSTNLVTSQNIDTQSGCLLPFHDIDTNLVMLSGKGDLTVSLFEFNESSKDLNFYSSEQLPQQTFGMGMTPKRVLDVMNGEVNRLYQLSKNLLIRIPYIIPRKSYNEFHADLFPDTVYSGKPSMSAEEWVNGGNIEIEKLSLDPKIGVRKPVVSGLKSKEKKLEKPEEKACAKDELSDRLDKTNSTSENNTIHESANTTNTIPEKNTDDMVGVNDSKTVDEKINSEITIKSEPEKEIKKTTFMKNYQSKYKHNLGEMMHKSLNIENIKNVSESLPAESNGFCCHKDIAIVPLAGAGGQLAVFQLSKPGRTPENIPTIQNSCAVLDFDMDPFNNYRIAVACEDWHVRVWKIPESGMDETLTEPKEILKGHSHRVTIVKFHPTANNILASAGHDLAIRIWDLNEGSEIGSLEGHLDQILSMAWHPDGKYLATMCKDKKIRVFEPVEDLEPIKEGEGPEVSKGARICWCGPKNNWLVVSSTYSGIRGMFLYDENLKELAKNDDLDQSPSVLTLNYDEASSVVFATGKGERIIYSFEIDNVPPYLHQLETCSLQSAHQAIALLRKDLVDVRRVEFARFARLCKKSIDSLSFTVPRVKLQYFQDDIFPEVRSTWKLCTESEDWLDGNYGESEWISLQPSDMQRLSEAQVDAPKAAKYCSREILSEKTDEEKKLELINAMVNKLDFDDKLEQDNFEGVDEDEWDD